MENTAELFLVTKSTTFLLTHELIMLFLQTPVSLKTHTLLLLPSPKRPLIHLKLCWTFCFFILMTKEKFWFLCGMMTIGEYTRTSTKYVNPHRLWKINKVSKTIPFQRHSMKRITNQSFLKCYFSYPWKIIATNLIKTGFYQVLSTVKLICSYKPTLP